MYVRTRPGFCAGDRGESGVAGSTGPRGFTGSTGPQGTKGSVGNSGAIGPAGSTGKHRLGYKQLVSIDSDTSSGQA